jgi:hypothetical protein
MAVYVSLAASSVDLVDEQRLKFVAWQIEFVSSRGVDISSATALGELLHQPPDTISSSITQRDYRHWVPVQAPRNCLATLGALKSTLNRHYLLLPLAFARYS